MKYYFLFILLIKNFYSFCDQIDCPIFKCSMKGMTDKKCFSSIEEYIDREQKTTIYLNQCSKNEKCCQTSWDPSI